jgi:hypothetical protein
MHLFPSFVLSFASCSLGTERMTLFLLSLFPMCDSHAEERHASYHLHGVVLCPASLGLIGVILTEPASCINCL